LKIRILQPKTRNNEKAKSQIFALNSNMSNVDIETIMDAEEFIQSTIPQDKKHVGERTLLKCIGSLCGGTEFDPDAPGCAAHLQYCPECNAAIRALLNSE
jgi:hypothetical protein